MHHRFSASRTVALRLPGWSCKEHLSSAVGLLLASSGHPDTALYCPTSDLPINGTS